MATTAKTSQSAAPQSEPPMPEYIDMEEPVPEEETTFDVDDDIDLAQYDPLYQAAEVDDNDYEEIPDGKYQVVVHKVELTRAKTSGNPMLKWQLRIIGPRFAGRMLFRNNMLATAENIKWLKRDLQIAGLQLGSLQELKIRLGDLLDVCLQVTKKKQGDYDSIWLDKRIEISAAVSGGGNGSSAELAAF